MKQFLDLLRRIDTEGDWHDDRTKVGRRSIFGTRMEFDLSGNKIPLLTTKKVHTDAIIKENCWFVQGDSDVNNLIAMGANIWNPWMVKQSDIDNPTDRIKRVFYPGQENFSIDAKLSDDELQTHLGSIGPLYGAMWRNAPGGGDIKIMQALHGDKYLEEMAKELATDKWAKIVADHPDNVTEQQHAVLQAYHTIDQLQQLMINLKRQPHSARHVISAWFPELLPDERLTPEENVLLGRQALAPCHCLFQFYVKNSKKYLGKMELECQLYQRSCDFPVGVPFNIVSYSMLVITIAQCLDMVPGKFIWIGGDTHYYSNQIEGVKEQLSRTPYEQTAWLKLNPEVKDLFAFKPSDFEIMDYKHQDIIKYAVAK